MNKHTPGVWDVDKTGYYIGKVSLGDIIEVAQILDLPYPAAGNREANAYLISAAPELLEVCKATLVSIQGADDQLERQLKQVIAKAEGK